MSQNDGDASRDHLIQSYLENQATAAEERQFRLLLNDESFCRRVAQYAIDLGCLHDHACHGILERALIVSREPVSRRRFRAIALAVVAASILLVVGTVWRAFLTGDTSTELASDDSVPLSEDDPAAPSPQEAARSVVARVTDVTGRVLIGTSSATQNLVEKEMLLHSGDRLQTSGADSFALLKFEDDSVLAVAGNTELTCSIMDSQKRIDVSRGDVMAQVAPQPDKPMVVKTPVAEAEVVGTRLSLFADLVLTELAVLEGHVRLKRLSDDETVDVRKGQCAVVSEASDLVAAPISPVPSVWEEDFEQRWPDRWREGHWIHYALPPESEGAVLAAARDETAGPCFISSPNEWSRGLFRIESDTCLNLTYKLKKQGWFYIMLETRAADYSGEYRGNYIYQTPQLWKVRPRQWQTVAIPLSEFHVPQRGRPEGAELPPPKAGDVVFSLLLRTQEADPGLVVDRIWVTKGPAEGAELLQIR
ncbi:MAG: hypothetical protein GXX96_15145 [Planctomycetaceae bacterium]|nr:hypothetical protein [Planctomycetaceae bacterium]